MSTYKYKVITRRVVVERTEWAVTSGRPLDVDDIEDAVTHRQQLAGVSIVCGTVETLDDDAPEEVVHITDEQTGLETRV
jgi:hypothetical protein